MYRTPSPSGPQRGRRVTAPLHWLSFAMLRLLRPSGSTPTLRRLVAALLVLMMGVACAEPLLADTCDGDAPRDHGAANTGGDVIGAADAPGSSTGDRVPAHAVHVCHCTHAHGGTLADGYVITTRTRPVARASDSRSDRLPPSPALEPHLRPPAPPHAA